MMKKRAVVMILAGFGLLFAGRIPAQITVELFIENAQKIGGTFSWEIHFKPLTGWTEAGGGESYLANASYYFDYNKAALSNPVITYVNPLCNETHYTSTTGIAGVSNEKVRVTQVAEFHGESSFVQGTKYHMYTVEMDIIDSGVSSGLDWDPLNNTGVENSAGSVADANDITFTGSGDQSLPVELSMFTAFQQGRAVILGWSTECETDNLGFILERSEPGDAGAQCAVPAAWQRIASYETHEDLRGRGNTSRRTQYQFIDESAPTGTRIRYRLSEVNTSGEVHVADILEIDLDAMPDETALAPATPNPFNPRTQIRYSLDSDAVVSIRVYDIMGRKVKTLIRHERQYAGAYHVFWNGRDEAGEFAASGVYLIRMTAGRMVKTRKVLLAR